MTALFIFIVAMFAVSAAVWVLATGFRLIDQRVEQWPLLWATALWLCVAVPALGLLLSLLPNTVAPEALAVFSLHAPIDAMGFIAGEPFNSTASETVASLAVIKIGVVGIYLAGVVLTLTKLGWGRHRLRRVILAADCADIAGQDDVLISAQVQSPFAYTPFGQVRHSRILLPQSYRGVVSQAQVLDILIHERAHISRRDDECGLALRVLLCLCWMSPFAYRLFAAWSQSTEIRCDMAVTAHRDPKMRKAYADTLVQALHIVAGRVQQYPAASFSTHRIRNEKMRIKHIMTGATPSFKRRRDKFALSVVAASVTVIGMVAISATASAGPAAQAEAPAQETSAQEISNVKTSKVKSVITPKVSGPIVSGRLTSKFGPAPDPFTAGKIRDHYGIDIAAPTGTPIYAPANGIILAATDAYQGNPAYGNVVALKTQGGLLTMFAHLDGYTVVEGQKVMQGTQIATVGSSGKSTGPHVHIETKKNGRRVDPATVWGFDLAD